MKKILIMLALAGSLFAQGRVATHPVWRGFQKISDGVIFNTIGGTTNVFKANEVLGVATLWIEADGAYTGTVTVTLYAMNDASGSSCAVGTFDITNLDDGANAVAFDAYWLAADWAFIGLTASTGQFVADVYVGIE